MIKKQDTSAMKSKKPNMGWGVGVGEGDDNEMWGYVLI